MGLWLASWTRRRRGTSHWLHLRAPVRRMPRSIERSQRRSRGAAFPYDAILVDEGQDFELDWWNLLRKQVRPDGEMLLVSDPTQNIYGQDSWTDEAHMLGAGFSGPVDRPRRFIPPPTDMVSTIRTFGREASRRWGGHLTDSSARPGALPFIDGPTERRWKNVRSTRATSRVWPASFADQLAVAVRRSRSERDRGVVRNARSGFARCPSAGTARSRRAPHLCERRRGTPAGKAAVLARCSGHQGVHDPQFQGLGVEGGGAVHREQARLGSPGLRCDTTRLQADPNGRPSYIGVVNANTSLNYFRDSFKNGVPLPPPMPGTKVADRGRLIGADTALT